MRKNNFGVNVGKAKCSLSPLTELQPGMCVAPRTPSHEPTPAALQTTKDFYLFQSIELLVIFCKNHYELNQ